MSLAWPERITTSVGTYSVHRVAPEFFGGFTALESGAKLATVEKALLDVAYLSASSTRLFSELPELELPRRLDHESMRAWIGKIPSPRARARVVNWLRKLPALEGERWLADRETVRLSDRGFDRMKELVDKPPAPTAALKSAVACRKR